MIKIFLQPRYLCIVMEYAPGGDMLEYVKRKNGLTENEARWFFQQLVIGLDYCHKMVLFIHILFYFPFIFYHNLFHH